MSSTFTVPKAQATPTTFTFAAPRPRAVAWLFFGRPKKHTMPLVQYLPVELRALLKQSVDGVTRDTLDEAQAQRIWESGMSIFDHYAPGLTSRLGMDQKIALQSAWYAASGITMGESSASSTS